MKYRTHKRKNSCHRQPWSDVDNSELIRLFGYMPLSQLAEKLRRTDEALLGQLRLLELPTVGQWTTVWTVTDFATRMGINRQAARRLVKGQPWSQTLYERNRAILTVVKREFKRWLANPLNWMEFDVGKIACPELRVIVEQSFSSDCDRWLTLDEAARHASYSYWGLHKAIRTGRLVAKKGGLGRKGRKLNLIKMSDLNQFVANDGNWKRYSKEQG